MTNRLSDVFVFLGQGQNWNSEESVWNSRQQSETAELGSHIGTISIKKTYPHKNIHNMCDYDVHICES